MYLPWNETSSDNTSSVFGNIAFILVSLQDDLLPPDSVINKPITYTKEITVWSWVTNSTLSERCPPYLHLPD